MDILDIRVIPDKNKTYQITIDRPPLGQTVTAPARFDQPLKDLLSPPSTQVEAEERGKALFNVLFSAELVDVLERNAVRSRERSGLRLQLDIRSSRLANLPWELLWNPVDEWPYTLQPGFSVVRYVEMPVTVQDVSEVPTIRWLFLGSSPTDQAPIDLQTERDIMVKALAHLSESGQVQLIAELETTNTKFHQMIIQEKPHVVYIAGHGHVDAQGISSLILQDDYSESYPISPKSLRLAFEGTNTAIVVLNVCRGGQAGSNLTYGLAGSILHGGVTVVVAMQDAISDYAAHAFSAGFVAALAGGVSVDDAVVAGRQMIYQTGSEFEWHIPLLFTRLPGGKLWTLSQKSSPNQAASSGPSRTINIDKLNGAYIEEAVDVNFNFNSRGDDDDD